MKEHILDCPKCKAEKTIQGVEVETKFCTSCGHLYDPIADFNRKLNLMKDTDLMPFGKFKGTAMANVPAEYLLWLYRENNEKTPEARAKWSEDQVKVYEYTKENYQDLKAEKAKNNAR